VCSSDLDSDELMIAMRDFEAANEIYIDFQRGMERYWCLRWLVQENITTTRSHVLRESLVRIDRIPLLARVPSLPEVEAGTAVDVDVTRVDLLGLDLDCRFAGKSVS
jgi:exoribonuclease-2